MMTKQFPPAVNWHVWASCNMNCRFCFAVFNDVKAMLQGRPSMVKADNLQLAKTLGSAFSKVSVAGGEALLCPYLDEILSSLKSSGTTTALITNGGRLIDDPTLLKRLAPFLDWIGVSIDSFDPELQAALGRAKSGSAYHPKQYVELASQIKQYGIRLKINSVVTQLTLTEDMVPWIRKMEPARWKVFQVLPISGQNDGDGKVDGLLISKAEFESFIVRHRLEVGDLLVSETNEAMSGSYAMVDPAGRFFDNTTGRLRYSQAILDVGIAQAWSQVEFYEKKFLDRGGKYEW